MARKREKSLTAQITDIMEEQAWGETTMINLYDRFVVANDLEEKFLKFLQDQQDFEHKLEEDLLGDSQKEDDVPTG